MTMTTHTKSLKHETVTAWIHRGGSDDTLREESQSLGSLKGRAWRVLTHDTAVQQGFPDVLTQQTMVFRTLAPHHHTGIIRGRRHHAEHLARRRFDGHDTSDFAFQESFAKRLQFCINGQRQILTRLSTLIQFSILISALNTTMGISEQNLDTLHATKLFLVLALHTQFPDIVARLIVVVLLNIGRRNLSHIAQHMGSHRRLILSDTALLYIKAGETEHLLLEDAKIFVRQLTDE